MVSAVLRIVNGTSTEATDWTIVEFYSKITGPIVVRVHISKQKAVANFTVCHISLYLTQIQNVKKGDALIYQS